jgi:CheY-like chemotaxis protein
MHKFNKVLLVDDDKATNFLSGKVLKNLHIAGEIMMAEDGLIACDIINKGKCPDIIFLDIRMPRMDGFDFLETLRDLDLCDHVKIVMLTTSMRSEDKERALSYPHVIDYREKPLTEEMIQQIVKAHF